MIRKHTKGGYMADPSLGLDNRYARRTGPRIVYPKGSREYDRTLYGLTDEFSELWDATHRIIEGRLRWTGDTDVDDLCGEVYWWAWTMMGEICGATEREFANICTGAGRKMARQRSMNRHGEVRESDRRSVDLTQLVEKRSSGHYTPPEKTESAEDVLEARIGALVAYLSYDTNPALSPTCEGRIGHSALMLAERKMTLEAATKACCLFLLAERTWPRITGKGAVTLYLRDTARLLIGNHDLLRHGLTATLAAHLEVSERTAERLVERTRLTVTTLYDHISCRSGDFDTRVAS